MIPPPVLTQSVKLRLAFSPGLLDVCPASMPLISVSVKHGKATLQLEMESALTILNAMEQIEQQTGVYVRSQKLIQAGKVLDPKLTLEQSKVYNGARWMLMAAAQGQTRVSPAAGEPPQQELSHP